MKTYTLLIFLIVAGCTQTSEFSSDDRDSSYSIIYELEAITYDDANSKLALLEGNNRLLLILEERMYGELVANWLFVEGKNVVECKEEEGMTVCNDVTSKSSPKLQMLLSRLTYSDTVAGIASNVDSIQGSEYVSGMQCTSYELSEKRVLTREEYYKLQEYYAVKSYLTSEPLKNPKINMTQTFDIVTKYCIDAGKRVLEVRATAVLDEPVVLWGMTATEIEEGIDIKRLDYPSRFSIHSCSQYADSAYIVITPLASGKMEMVAKKTPSMFDNEPEISAKPVALELTRFQTKFMEINFPSSSKFSDKEICIDNDCVVLSGSLCPFGEESCLMLSSDEESCGQAIDCMSSNGLCLGFSCGRIDDENKCNAQSRCKWVYDAYFMSEFCKPRNCKEITSSNDCYGTQGCNWNGQTCYNPTATSTMDECEQILGCKWEMDTCNCNWII